jgi:hypothetical protein
VRICIEDCSIGFQQMSRMFNCLLPEPLHDDLSKMTQGILEFQEATFCGSVCCDKPSLYNNFDTLMLESVLFSIRRLYE